MGLGLGLGRGRGRGGGLGLGTGLGLRLEFGVRGGVRVDPNPNLKQEAARDGVRCLPPQPEGYDLVIEGDGFLYKMVPPTPYPDP